MSQNRFQSGRQLSVAAYRSIQPHLARCQERVLKAVRALQRCNARQVHGWLKEHADVAGGSVYFDNTRSRLTELCRMNLIRIVADELDLVTGQSVFIYQPTDGTQIKTPEKKPSRSALETRIKELEALLYQAADDLDMLEGSLGLWMQTAKRQGAEIAVLKRHATTPNLGAVRFTEPTD